MISQIKHLLTKAKYLLYLESKLSAQEVALNQWQLLASHHGITYIVGRGGANTCFYKVGDAERTVCYPNELIDIITKWSKQQYVSFSIYSKDKRLIKKGYTTLELALARRPAFAGMWIVGITPDRVKRRLYYSVSGLKEHAWVKVEKK